MIGRWREDPFLVSELASQTKRKRKGNKKESKEVV